MRTVARLVLATAAIIAFAGAGSHPAKADPAPPITLAYSDWPGWTCWDIAQKEGIFAKHHCNVKLVWFGNYSDSLNAMAAGKVDGNCQTWSDTLPQLSQGVPLKAVLINDNSAGNDAIVARAGITSVKQLRGLNVATELGTCDQFLLDEALNRNGMSEADIHYINIAVQDCPAAMVAGKIDACVVWEPNKSQLLSQLKGSHDIYDSRSIPGLIPDLLIFQTKVVQERPKDIQNIVDAWYDMLTWWRAHPTQAVTIMAARTESPVSFYQGFVKGTRIFDAPEAVSAFKKTAKMTSLYTSGDAICGFLLHVQPPQIDSVPDYAAALDPTYVDAAAAKGEGKQPPLDYGLKVN